KVREFESAPPPQPPYQLIVLDGQQRLTSLYQALYGRGDFRYGVRFTSLHPDQSIEELEESIISLPVDRWHRNYPDARAEYKDGIVPVEVLREAALFYEWRDRALLDEAF